MNTNQPQNWRWTELNTVKMMLIRPPRDQDDSWSKLCYSACCPLPPLVHSWPWNSSLLIFFFFLVTAGSMWDISSPTRDQIHTPLPWKRKVLTTWLLGKSLKFPLKSSWELALYRSPPFPQVAGLRNKADLPFLLTLVSRGWAYKQQKVELELS